MTATGNPERGVVRHGEKRLEKVKSQEWPPAANAVRRQKSEVHKKKKKTLGEGRRFEILRP